MMKPPDKAKQALEKMSFQAGEDLRRDIKRDMIDGFQRSNCWRGFRMAVAAVVILGFMVTLHMRRPPEVEAPVLYSASTPSLAELVTSRSLNRTLKSGGFQALNAHLDQADRLAGPRPDSPSVDDLLDEIENLN